MTPLKILVYDVETSWMLAKTFTTKPDYIRHDQLVHGWFLHCWAAQWHGEKKMLSDCQTTAEAQGRDDKRITESLASLVREADYVLAHNGDNFDLPRLRNRVITHNLEPLGPVQTIDTLKIARKLGFVHNNLEALGIALGVGQKVETPKHLWDQTYEGDEKALRLMLKYCEGDVVLLAQIFDRLRPHATRLPRLVDGEGAFCTNCGSTHYQKRGFYRTAAGTAQRYQCQACGGYFKESKSDAGRRQMRPI